MSFCGSKEVIFLVCQHHFAGLNLSFFGYKPVILLAGMKLSFYESKHVIFQRVTISFWRSKDHFPGIKKTAFASLKTSFWESKNVVLWIQRSHFEGLN